MLNVYSLHLTGGAVVRRDTRGLSYLLLCVQWVGPTGVQLAGRHTGLQFIYLLLWVGPIGVQWIGLNGVHWVGHTGLQWVGTTMGAKGRAYWGAVGRDYNGCDG